VSESYRTFQVLLSIDEKFLQCLNDGRRLASDRGSTFRGASIAQRVSRVAGAGRPTRLKSAASRAKSSAGRQSSNVKGLHKRSQMVPSSGLNVVKAGVRNHTAPVVSCV